MKVNKTFIAILVIAIALAVDQYTKGLALQAAFNQELPIEVTSFFNIAFAWNTGISFSFFSSDDPMTRFVLTGFAFLLSLVLLIWLLREKIIFTKIGFAFIISGAIGNALDRIRYGAVVDFIDLHYSDWHFPVFNIADISINLGVGLILIHILFFTQKTDGKKN